MFKPVRAEVSGGLGIGVRGHPCCHLDTPLHDHMRDHGFILSVQMADQLISLKPVFQPAGGLRAVFLKAHGRGNVVNKPAHAAIVKINDARTILVQQQIGKAQISMDQAITPGSLAVGAQFFANSVQGRFQKQGVLAWQAGACPPIPPMGARANHAFVVPDNALEACRFLPLAAMLVEARRDLAKLPQGARV